MYECDVTTEFFQWSEPRARKEYDCCECGAPIEKGERHFQATGKWEGDFFSVRQHLLCCQTCMVIRDDIQHGNCIPFGSLMDYCQEFRLDIREQARSGQAGAKKLRSLLYRIKRRERAASMAPRGDA
jgi:hypothetical protein